MPKVILSQPPGKNMGPTDFITPQVNDEKITMHYGEVCDIPRHFADMLDASRIGFTVVDELPDKPGQGPPAKEPEQKEKEQEHDDKAHTGRTPSWRR